MSMSEFENEWENQCIDASLLLKQELGLPEDFTADDMAFAQEMESLFSPSQEELPPYFVQTLLEAENPRFQPIEHGLEYKTRAHVFRRLKLRRRLFRSTLFSTIPQYIRPQRVHVAILLACFLFVFFTMIATGPSFASGLNVLFSGRHAGVLQVPGYPLLSVKSTKKTHNEASILNVRPKRITLLDAQQQLEFAVQRPLSLPNHYVLSSMYLYQGVDQSWADGPALELEYSYMRQGSISHGTGQISVCEFRPNGQVLQVVQLGAAHTLQIGRDGQTQAIYVDGQWVRVNNSHDWIYGGRSEIIYEHDGVIFWIVGDQRDGVGQSTLLKIANSLQPLSVRDIHLLGNIDSVIVPLNNATWPFADDIVYTNEPNGSSLEIVSSNMSSGIHVLPKQTPVP